MSQSILFISDLHISKSHPILLQDIGERLDEIAEYIAKNEVEYLVILGDIFDKNDPRYTIELLMFYQFLSRVLELCDKILIIGGNHGVTNLEQSALGTIEQTLSHLLSDEQILKIHIVDYTGTPMRIVDMGGCKIGAVSHLPKIYLKEHGYDMYEGAIQALMLDQEVDIFCSHFPVVGVQLGSYQLVNASVEPDILRNMVKANHIILGDIHQGQTLGGNPPIIYAGSVERMNFGECGDEKRALIYQIDEKAVGFVKLNARPRFTGEYTGDELEKLLADIDYLDKSRLRLKLRINLKSGQDVERIVSEFKKALSGIFEVHIDPFVEVERKVKTPELMEARSDLDIFRAFVKANVKLNNKEILKIGEEIVHDNQN